jgi:hypothetical protein
VLPSRVETIFNSLQIGNAAKWDVILEKSSISDAAIAGEIRKRQNFVRKIEF